MRMVYGCSGAPFLRLALGLGRLAARRVLRMGRVRELSIASGLGDGRRFETRVPRGYRRDRHC